MIEWREKKYCKECPFNGGMHVSEERLDDIKKGLREGGNFICHETAYPEMFDRPANTKRTMCYGAYVYLNELNKPNTIMQIAERLGV